MPFLVVLAPSCVLGVGKLTQKVNLGGSEVAGVHHDANLAGCLLDSALQITRTHILAAVV